MTFNPNFYNNFRGNNFTFQNNFMQPNVPPPPPPPRFFLPPTYVSEVSDQEYMKNVEAKMVSVVKTVKPTIISINKVREILCNTVHILKEIKDKEMLLKERLDALTELEWSLIMGEIQKKKNLINNYMAQIKDSNLDMLRKLLARRSAKRLRLRRVCLEKKCEKEERIKEREERSRKIDENLQKIKDDINRVKQEEEAKFQADIVLKEVLRKKYNAKKCIVKLDALMKLRRARQNTAKGRGETVSENDAVGFNNNIVKLKSLWTQKLTIYEKEESDLRAKLTQENEEQNETDNETEKKVKCGLEKWREVLFGGSDTTPQVDFRDVGRFINIRSQWDQFISSDGSPLPVGWVLPVDKT